MEKRDPRLHTATGRQEMIDEVMAIRDKAQRLVAEEVVAKTQARALKVYDEMSEMLGEAKEKVGDIMRAGENETNALKAAMYILGVFGVTEKRLMEVGRGNVEDRMELVEELKSEFRKELEKSKGEVIEVEVVKDGN